MGLRSLKGRGNDELKRGSVKTRRAYYADMVMDGEEKVEQEERRTAGGGGIRGRGRRRRGG